MSIIFYMMNNSDTALQLYSCMHVDVCSACYCSMLRPCSTQLCKVVITVQL